MDLRKLKKLIDLVQESGIAELEITEGEERVRIASGGSVSVTPLAAPAPVAAALLPAGPAPAPAARGAGCECGSSRGRRPRRQVADGRHLLPGAVAGREAIRRGRAAR